MTSTRRWSAARWAQFAQLTYLVAAAPFAAALVGFLASVAVDRPLREELIEVSSWLMILSICGVGSATIFGTLIVPARQRAEARQGTTTFRLAGQELNQVVPGTDTIVRKAGDPT